ncbi:hypothetical protein [uncultured Thiohalocapsa sp.]|uniref:hypothetical protein n=1 Tax=uncultured Thiohalocapsa sp. TaxID=768990 RepID=UPI0025E996CB|nr:hypothetical protein [uncultured Thiohalocapsa sp.]
MGKILDDMTRLRGDMDRGHEARRAAGQARADEMAELGRGVADMIGGFASARQVQFGQDQAARGAFIGNIVQGVQDLTREVGAMMERVHDDRMETARADAAARQHEVADRVQDIRAKLGDFQEQMAAFRDEFAAASEQEARVRLGFVADKAHEVANMLGEFRKTHAEQTEADADARRDFIADISSQVRTLQSDVSADLAGIRALFDGGMRVAPKPAAKPKPSQPAPKTQPAAARPAEQQPPPVAKAADADSGGNAAVGMTPAMDKDMDGDKGGKRAAKKQGNKAET